jgi:hypothetical protein
VRVGVGVGRAHRNMPRRHAYARRKRLVLSSFSNTHARASCTPFAAQAWQRCLDGMPSRDVGVPESSPQPAGVFAPHKRRLRGTAQDFGSCADATNPAATRRASVFTGSQAADPRGREACPLRPKHAAAMPAQKQNRPHLAAGRQFAASDAGRQ